MEEETRKKIEEELQPEEIPTGVNIDGSVKPQDTALNGAQVKSLLDIVMSVTTGDIPRETGVKMITESFNMDEAAAEDLMGPAGKEFKAELPAAEA